MGVENLSVASWAESTEEVEREDPEAKAERRVKEKEEARKARNKALGYETSDDTEEKEETEEKPAPKKKAAPKKSE